MPHEGKQFETAIRNLCPDCGKPEIDHLFRGHCPQAKPTPIFKDAPAMTYDSRTDTYEHIQSVQRKLHGAIVLLHLRQRNHDHSKLHDPEKATFDEFTPKLRGMTYGSDEYKSCLAAMKPALDHHYACNSHHPEHYRAGIRGMSLLDVIEMLCDWAAATERHADGDLAKSIEINQKRFGYSDELKQILMNTASELALLDVSVKYDLTCLLDEKRVVS